MPRNIARYSIVLVVLIAALGGCRQAEPPAVTNVIVARVDALPADPSQDAWNAAPEYIAPLILQDLVDPRLMQPSTAELRVRALTDGSRLAFRLQWADPTCDDVDTADTFADACAVQLPAKIEPTVPAPQMGEQGHPVEIAYWSAVWQAAVDGRGNSLKDLYPNATVDHYPFQAASLEPGSPEQQAMAARYAPAQSLGNRMAGPRETPVQDLVAEGPGTLKPAAATVSAGRGLYGASAWTVVLSRPLPEELRQDPQTQTQIAFAVWEGAHHEAGSRKMRTGWITLSQQEKP
jgi:DMSO reductase family type II enzyme heme b subunit